MVRKVLTLGFLLAVVECVAARTHVVVPCYNELARLPRKDFLEYASDAANADVFFTFVNDGSRDGTLGMLKALAASRPSNVFVLDLPQNGGKAEAVRLGMNHVIKVCASFPGSSWRVTCVLVEAVPWAGYLARS